MLLRYRLIYRRTTVKIDTPLKTMAIVYRREAEVDNGFRGVSISTVTHLSRHYLSYFIESPDLIKNFTAFNFFL